jgi:uncharacterized membrane protein YgaE (UPF0421/DUF939 family)
MHPDNVTKLNGVGLVFRFITPFLGITATILSSVVLMYLSGLKSDMIQTKIEAKSCFDKLEATAQLNFNNINVQLGNHLSHHQQFDKEIFERLSCIETKIKNGR